MTNIAYPIRKFLFPNFVIALLLATLAPPALTAVVYSNGPSDLASANNMGIALQADNFSLAASTTLREIQFTSLEGVGAYRNGIYWAIASDASGSPGVLISDGFQSTVTRASGGTAFGLSEFTNQFLFNSLIALGAGDYWLVLHNGANNDFSDPNDFYWGTSANNSTSRGMESYDGGASWDTNLNEHAFTLFAADVIDVPEPPTLFIAAIGLLMCWSVRRRMY